jgi:hypothetical protein
MLGFAAGCHPLGTHLCLLFDGPDELNSVLLPYLSTGIRDGHLVEFAVDVDTAEALEERRARLHVPFADKIFVTIATEQRCSLDGSFRLQEMLEGFRDMHQRVQRGGYAGGRVFTEMTWALRGHPGSEQLAEFEASLNELIETLPLTVICAYDTRRFAGDLLADIVAAHPVTLAGQHWIVNESPALPEQIRQMRSLA